VPLALSVELNLHKDWIGQMIVRVLDAITVGRIAHIEALDADKRPGRVFPAINSRLVSFLLDIGIAGREVSRSSTAGTLKTIVRGALTH
jgi:hypothetical protein